MLLPQRFKHADGSGIAEIEAPRLRADGDADTAVIVRGEKILRQTSGLLAEEQIGPVGVIGLVVAAGRLGGKQAQAGRMILCKEIVQILIHPNVYQVPVVEPRALDRLVGNVKAQGLHEMQDAAGRGAGARDISGVGPYIVTYLAKDRSGNETKIERKIKVKENPDWNEKVVYLTFDDGPSENTGEILDILKEKNAKATFFVTGNNQEHDDMIKRAFSEGHSIGLHTYTHDYATVYASEDAYFADLQKVSDLVESITGTKSMIIRFPGGSSNTISAKYVKGLMTTLTKAVRDKGYQYFDWNCDSTDASGNNVPVEKLVSNATSCTANHVDILMHDTDAKDTTVQALPQIIDYYRSQGYTFKGLTVDSVAAHHGVNN